MAGLLTSDSWADRTFAHLLMQAWRTQLGYAATQLADTPEMKPRRTGAKTSPSSGTDRTSSAP